jgi:uncharacterized protein YdeI (YjbR/CyaY-like superfamily)
MEPSDPVTMKDRTQWRSWLAEHSPGSNGVWLVFCKKHANIKSVSYPDAVEEANCFGWIDGKVRALDNDRYMQRFSPRKTGSSWSETNIARARKMVAAGLMTVQGLAPFNEAIDAGRVVPSIDTFIIPADLQRAFEENETLAGYYQGLTISQKRMFSLWINDAKREATREKRVRKSIELLLQGRNLIDEFGIRKRKVPRETYDS